MTVQNTKLSGYNPNRQHSSMPSYLGLPRISGWKKFANLFEPDTPNKLKCDCFCTGRSMVEMLGVLAIVGVLSVGAIAGYSKAMNKYRLNKQAEQISWLLNVLQRYKTFFGKEPAFLDFMPYLIKLGEIPQEMIKNNTDSIYDSFGMKYQMRTNGCNPACHYANLRIDVTDNYKNFDICNNIFETSKAFSEQLNIINFWQTNTDNTNNALYIWGDKVCCKSCKCLRTLTKNDIYEICQLCADKKGCSFNIQYLIKD